MSKAYVLLSGGVDSSTALALALDKHKTATAIGIKYGQRHTKELDHAQQVAVALGANFVEWNLEGVIAEGGLTDPNLEVPQVPYSELPEGVSPTYVPFRNGILLSVATGIASVDPDAEYVYYGAHAEDAENDAYPDCSPPFIAAMQAAISIGTYDKIKLVAPFQHHKKHEIVLRGKNLMVPYHLTWSCYEGGQVHCGKCSTCLARKEAFNLAKVSDPTPYLS